MAEVNNEEFVIIDTPTGRPASCRHGFYWRLANKLRELPDNKSVQISGKNQATLHAGLRTQGIRPSVKRIGEDCYAVAENRTPPRSRKTADPTPVTTPAA